MKQPTRVAALSEIAEIDRVGVDPSLIVAGTLSVGLENITGEGGFEGVKTVAAGELASTKFMFSPKHILYGKLRPYLRKIARPQFTGICSTDILPILPGPDVDRNYLAHYLRTDSMVSLAKSRSSGANLPRLSPSVLGEFRIPLPPLPEQRRIGAILDHAEELRAKRRETLAQAAYLETAVFLDLFGNPASSSSGWPRRPIKEIGKVTTGRTPPSSMDGMFGGPIPFVTPGDLESCEPVKRSVTEAGAKEVVTVRAGATLVCCIGATIGKIGHALTRSAFNQQINAVEWGKDIEDSYGFAVIRLFKPTIVAWGASTTLPILKKSAFERIEIPVPPRSLQFEFARRVHSIEKGNAARRKSATELSTLFAALQQRAFRGEL